MDFVYIVKNGDKNDDLRQSLRSIAKFYPDHKVWIVGYKPKWVQNVSYLPVVQGADKWSNSVNNIIAACKCPEISEDFILMNDDFFILKKKCSLEEVCNMNLGTLDKAIRSYANRTTKWCKAFKLVGDLLKKINTPGPYYNYEAHLPISINKTKYLEVMNLSEVQAFIRTGNVLHKRSLYKNIADKPGKTISPDVKVKKENDDTVMRMEQCGWVSVYDNQVGNAKYSKLNSILTSTFPNLCKYESSGISNVSNTSSPTIVYPKRSIVKRSNHFIHY